MECTPPDEYGNPMPALNKVLKTNVHYTSEQMALIRMGHESQSMEDKWDICMGAGDELRFHRSWTGGCWFIARFLQDKDGYWLNEVVLNRDPEQRLDADDGEDLEIMTMLIDVLLLGKMNIESDVSAINMWSLMGGAMLSAEALHQYIQELIDEEDQQTAKQ